MIDIEIAKFYNSVKDPAWPDIASYHEYTQLPHHIKNECNNLHQLNLRKNEICDADHWINQTLHVCVYENLAYVPIPKCAYTYHTTMLNDMGWKKVLLCDVDVENTKFFGMVMHPLIRRHKGIAEWIVQSYYKHTPITLKNNPWSCEDNDIDWAQLHTDIDSPYFKKMLSNIGVGDPHSFSYHATCGSFINKVNWIPLDTMTKHETLHSIMNFFKLHGHHIQLPLNNPPLNVSDQNQLQVYNIVKETFDNTPRQLYDFYKIYSNDLKFYYNLLDNFTPDWQHI